MLRIPVAKDWEAEIREPTRGEYPDNLGGAFEFTVTHFIYKVLEICGESIGVFLGGAVVKFLDTVEPHMVKYVSPLIDGILETPDLPDWFIEFLTGIRNPEDEVGAGLLQTFSGTMVSGISGALLPALFAGVAQKIQQKTRHTIPDPGTLYAMLQRGVMAWTDAREGMELQGYPDGVINNIYEVIRPRLDAGAMAEGLRRGFVTRESLKAELTKRGYTTEDIGIALNQNNTLLDVGNIITAFRRQDMTAQQTDLALSNLGFLASDRATILQNSALIPGVGDLVQMAVREAWRDDIADAYNYDEGRPGEFDEWVGKQGMDPVWAKRYWRAHWQLPSVSLAFDMYHRGIIGEGELRGLLQTADYPAGWREKMIAAAYHPITRVDVRRFYRLGLLSYEELVNRYKMLGYNPDDAVLMADFTVKYESADPEDEVGKARELTRSVYEKAYKLGKISREETVTHLSELGYSSESIELSLSLVDIQKELDTVPDYMEDYRADLSNLILKSYTKRMIDGQRATEYLLDLGLDPTEIPLKLSVADYAYSEAMKDHAIDLVGESYIKRVITQNDAYAMLGSLDLTGAQQSQILGEWDVERQLRTRTLSEAQYRKAMQEGLMTVDDYTEAMRGLGYNERDVGVLVGMATFVPGGAAIEEGE